MHIFFNNIILLCWDYVCPPLGSWRGTQSLSVEGVGGANSDDRPEYAVLLPMATLVSYSCCKYFYVNLFAIEKCKQVEEKMYKITAGPSLRYNINVRVPRRLYFPALQ